jgi:hypothetical protein
MSIKIDSLLRAHSFMRLESPPTLWEADAEDWLFIPLLGEMIVVGLTRGNKLEELTLLASNVVVEAEAASDVPQGEYVALSVIGRGDWSPEWRWRPGDPFPGSPYASFDRLATSGVAFAYARVENDGGSVTVFLPRLDPPDAS